MTDSIIVVKSHRHQEHTLCGGKGKKNEELGHTPHIADGPVKAMNVD
jgi:hypothetical protein